MVEVHELDGGASFSIGDAKVVTGATDHRPVEPTLGYRIEHDGATVVLGGDGVPCAGLDELCADADVYVQTVIRADLVRAIDVVRLQDILGYHSTIEQAAQTAARCRVGTLLATHFVPAIAPGDEPDVARARPPPTSTGPSSWPRISRRSTREGDAPVVNLVFTTGVSDHAVDAHGSGGRTVATSPAGSAPP